MRIDIITIFPNYFEPLKLSLLGSAVEKGILNLNIVNLRDFATDKHSSVDDTIYGGGAGMLMKADVIERAIDSCLETANVKPILIFTAAFGKKFNQKLAVELAKTSESEKHLIFICGRFEGYDARIVPFYLDKLGEENVLELSIGEFVLFGGEAAVLVMTEAITRLIPGVIGNENSLNEESFSEWKDGETALEYPSFTRPRVWNGLEVPEVLLNGNHLEIEKWRKNNAR